ncbi:hypothetical protein DFJ77DRAFT_438321 [Powellomyces hirtus]|nr:hypothetical protein DFJ77DRAFT_438321 [Powellomyces hirtus]
MGDKKMNFNARQSLQFQAETPNFLKLLQSAVNPPGRQRKDRSIPNFEGGSDDDDNDNDSGPDVPERDDEKPQIVVEKGITDMEVRRFRGEDAKPADDGRKRGADADSGNESGKEAEDTSGAEDADDGGKVKFRRPKAKKAHLSSAAEEKRRNLNRKKKESLKDVKKIKNKKLLSFGDEEG